MLLLFFLTLAHTRLAAVAATHSSADWFLDWFQVLLLGLVLLQSD